MPLLRRLEKNSPVGDARRRRPMLLGLMRAVSLSLVLVDRPFGYAFATPRAQDEAPPPPPPKKQTMAPANRELAQPDTASKTDQKKAKNAYKRGLKSEAAGDWQAASDAYSVAVDFDANVTQYGLHQAIAKGHVVEMKVDAAEKAAVSGDLTTALHFLREARELDPS